MNILLSANSFAQFFTVLVIFVAVLGITAWATRWMANYQKQQNENGNIAILETVRITNNKYLQLVRVGETYMAIAVCKDTVTMLGEIPAEQLVFRDSAGGGTNFRELFEKALKRDAVKASPKASQIASPKGSPKDSKEYSSDRIEIKDGDE
ncbi:MAG: flagellar biosynthetic protein FliO [Lachnospiraceae bacterium]|nr:flagellar biosynthetic protein FliO [Lachnospiraceae bacterium]